MVQDRQMIEYNDEGYATLEFAGVSRTDNEQIEIPGKARGRFNLNGKPELSFQEAIRLLPTATTAQVKVENPLSGANAEIQQAVAVVNPELAEQHAMGKGVDPDSMVYDVASKQRSITNPTQLWDPFADAMHDAELGDEVWGQFRVYEHGARVHGDLLFNDSVIEFEDRDPLYTGIQIGNSFDGSSKIYAAGYAMDTHCTNSMRNITDKRERKHVQAADDETAQDILDEIGTWWAEILQEMGAMTDHLREAIETAVDVEIDFLDQPFDVEEFYRYLDLPPYIAKYAAADAKIRSENEGGSRVVINLWCLHSGLTAALTHEYRGSTETGKVQDYYRIARDLIWNPQEIVERVERAYVREQEAEADEGEAVFEGGSGDAGLVQIQQLGTTIEERKAEFEQNEELMQQIMSENDGSGDDE